MMKRFMRQYGYMAIVITVMMLFAAMGVAGAEKADAAWAPSALNQGVAWENLMDIFIPTVRSLATVISVITIAITGGTILLDGGGINGRRMAYLVLGITLITNTVWFFADGDKSLFGKYIDEYLKMSSTISATPVSEFKIEIGDGKSIDFIELFIDYFEKVCMYGAARLMPVAFKILAFFTIIEFIMNLLFNLESDPITYLMKTILKTGFFIWIIGNWFTGDIFIADSIFSSFEKLGVMASGADTMADGNHKIVAGQTIISAFNIVATMCGDSWAMLKNFNIIASLTMLLCMVLTVFVIFMVTVEIIVTRLEFWIFAMISVPLIPFGAYQHTRFLFERFIGGTVNLGVKLMVLTFIVNIVSPIMTNLVTNFANTANDAEHFVNNIVILLMILFAGVTMYMLATKAPSLVAGLMNGNPSLAGTDLKSATAAAVGGAVGAATGVNAARGVVQAASTMRGGGAALAAAGNTSKLAQMAGTGKNLLSMAGEAARSKLPVVGGAYSGYTAARNLMDNKQSREDQQKKALEPRDKYETDEKTGEPIKDENGQPIKKQKTEKDKEGNVRPVFDKEGKPVYEKEAGWKPGERSDYGLNSQQSEHLGTIMNDMKSIKEHMGISNTSKASSSGTGNKGSDNSDIDDARTKGYKSKPEPSTPKPKHDNSTGGDSHNDKYSSGNGKTDSKE